MRLEAEKHALVIGGGVAGSARRAGYCPPRPEGYPGGEKPLSGRTHGAMGTRLPYARRGPSVLLKQLIDQCAGRTEYHHPYRRRGDWRSQGYVGNFQVTIRQQPRGVRGTFPTEEEADRCLSDQAAAGIRLRPSDPQGDLPRLYRLCA
ncbi:MAG: hypothetical protein MZV63_72160 [Marinilabiliales bacterium]|nr:hypothetical protein [Marinilabiliales bacterium]